MGARSTRTVREIDEIRERIDSELDALEERLPPEVIKRRALVVAGGIVLAVAGFWLVTRKVKSKAQDRRVRRMVREALEELDTKGSVDDLAGKLLE